MRTREKEKPDRPLDPSGRLPFLLPLPSSLPRLCSLDEQQNEIRFHLFSFLLLLFFQTVTSLLPLFLFPVLGMNVVHNVCPTFFHWCMVVVEKNQDGRREWGVEEDSDR